MATIRKMLETLHSILLVSPQKVLRPNLDTKDTDGRPQHRVEGGFVKDERFGTAGLSFAAFPFGTIWADERKGFVKVAIRGL